MNLGLRRQAARLGLGLRLLLALGARDHALRWTERLLSADASNTHALATRAHLLVNLGRPGAALADLAQLVCLVPQQATAWFNLGFVQEALGQLDEATQSLARATELDPAMDRAWYGLGLCHIRCGRWDDAGTALQRSAELQPLSPHAWYQLARVHLERGQTDEAQRVLVHLRGFEPKVADQLERDTGLRAASA